MTLTSMTIVAIPGYIAINHNDDILGLDGEELDIEVERGVGGNHASSAAAAVPQLRRYRDLAAFSDLQKHIRVHDRTRRRRVGSSFLLTHGSARQRRYQRHAEGNMRTAVVLPLRILRYRTAAS